MINKILNSVTHYTHIPADKIFHLFAGLGISVITGYTIVRLSSIDWLFFTGIFAAALAGCLKEYIWDKKLKKGTFEVGDILVTIYGGAIGLAILSFLL